MYTLEVFLIIMKFIVDKTIKQSIIEFKNAKVFINSIVEKIIKFWQG